MFGNPLRNNLTFLSQNFHKREQKSYTSMKDVCSNLKNGLLIKIILSNASFINFHKKLQPKKKKKKKK